MAATLTSRWTWAGHSTRPSGVVTSPSENYSALGIKDGALSRTALL